MQRQTVLFAIVSGALLAFAVAALSLYYRTTTQADVELMAERNNVALAKLMAKSLSDDLVTLVAGSPAMDDETLHDGTMAKRFESRIRTLTTGSSITEVTIFGPDLRVLYSTEDDEIGTRKDQDAGLIAAFGGKPTSRIVRKNLETLDGKVSDRNVVESYVPVFGKDNGTRPLAVFEIYDDVTEVLTGIQASQIQITVVVGLLNLLIHLGLVAIVHKGNRRLAAEHGNNLKLTAAAARAQAASQAKSDFLANMSHELRTPLNAVIGFSEMIKDELLGPVGSDSYRDYAKDIHVAGSHLLAIVNDILDIVKADSGTVAINLSEISIAESFNYVHRALFARAQEGGVNVTVQIAPEVGSWVSDEVRLRQVVLNLASNAVKFTPRGGSVLMSARFETQGLVIIIADTGIGISAEDLPKAMAPFGQVDSTLARVHEGTGLGLPLAKSLTETLGGTIVIESAVGKGTTVTVTLPALKAGYRPGMPVEPQLLVA